MQSEKYYNFKFYGYRPTFKDVKWKLEAAQEVLTKSQNTKISYRIPTVEIFIKKYT